MSSLRTLIADRNERALEQALFGSADHREIAHELGVFIERELGSINDVLFYRAGVGLVVGLDTANAGQVVLKVHRRESHSVLTAVQQVQAGLVDAGFPAPRPVMEPTALGRGVATVEEFIRSDRVDGRSPAIRRELARGLHGFIAAVGSVGLEARVAAEFRVPPTQPQLWAEPHDLRFDFERTARGAEWIDELAAQSQQVLSTSTLPAVIAHLDWRVENVAFRNDRLVGVYDWDSLGRVPEPVAVGQAAAQFSTDWTVGHSTLPTVTEMTAFVEEYESARGGRFRGDEAAQSDAANLMLIAYAARCEHSDTIRRPEFAPSQPPSLASLLTARLTQPLVRRS